MKKKLIRIPASHIRVPGFESVCAPSYSFLLMHTLGVSRWWLQGIGLSSWALVLPWPSAGCCVWIVDQ